MIRNNLIIIGCGVHFREKYYPVLVKEKRKIELVIDLEDSKKEIIKFFAKNDLKPRKLIFFEEKYRNHIDFLFL